MTIDSLIKILIIIHVVFGIIALLSGGAAIISKKGSKSHKLTGNIFYFSLAGSILLSLVVSLYPSNFNLFLFSVGIFSVYFLVIGKRAIKYKNDYHNYQIDRTIHFIMGLVSLAMIFAPIIIYHSIHIVACLFGLTGLVFAGRNLVTLKDNKSLKHVWLKLHISHISGAYISAVSAFFVVNEILPGLLNWFIPGLIGGLFIAFHIKTLPTSTKSPSNETGFNFGKKLLVFTIIFLPFFYLTAQNDEISTTENMELSLRFGLSFNKINDKRISNTDFKNWSPKYGIQFENRKPNSLSKFQIDLIIQNQTHDAKLLKLKTIRPVVSYSYQFKIRDDFWMGAFLNQNTLLNFPKSKTGLFTNNPISYTMAQSLGVRFGYSPENTILNNRKQEMMGSIEIPILSYVIQPIYGHPYPVRYLEENVFSPTQSGMTIPMLKSGKIVSFGKYRGIKISLGICYYISNKYKTGLEYQGEIFYANTTGKAVQMLSNDITILAGCVLK